MLFWKIVFSFPQLRWKLFLLPLLSPCSLNVGVRLCQRKCGLCSAQRPVLLQVQCPAGPELSQVRLSQRRTREQGHDIWLQEGHRHASALMADRSFSSLLYDVHSRCPGRLVQALDEDASSWPAELGQSPEGGCILHTLSPNLHRVLLTFQPGLEGMLQVEPGS